MSGCGAAHGRTGVAAMLTGGATGRCGVGMVAPLMWRPAMDAWVGGRGVGRKGSGQFGEKLYAKL